MGSLISALIIAIVQGITEWIPVSSSGHLVLAEKILDYSTNLDFNVALHFGTLMAVFVYFGKDIVDICEDLLKGRWRGDNSKAGFMIAVATIPAVVVGLIFRSYFEAASSNLAVLMMSFACTGVYLLIASVGYFRSRQLNWKIALIIGIAQAFALFPGISRSGATIATGLILGLKENDAMKFSFILSVPVVFGANIIEIGNKTLSPELIWATLVSFLVGLVVLHLLYKYILTNRKNLKWFGFYCFILAAALGLFLLL